LIQANRQSIITTRTELSSDIAHNSTAISQNIDDIADNRSMIQQNSNELSEVREDLSAGIAAAAALVTITPSAPGKTTINLGFGHFDGESALGATFAHRLSSNLLPSGDAFMINGGISMANSDVLSRVGASWEF
ncbi:MAG: YadA C-terminal domain-containing protein, partial [Desulfuromonadales bacterium]|nr:YadA C-terminal domain-containing protein [Desulfuromonadales bacterium]